MSLEELKTTAKEVDQNSGGFMEPKLDKPKGAKRGPKPKNKTEPPKDAGPQKTSEPEIEIPTAAIMKPVAAALNQAAIKIAEDKRAQMTPDEENVFCEIGGKLLDKYAPNVFSKYGLEAVMIISLSTWGLRVYHLRQHNLMILRELKKQKDSKPANSQDATPTPEEPKNSEAVFKDMAVEIPPAPVIQDERWDN